MPVDPQPQNHDERVDRALTALLVLQGVTLFAVIPFGARSAGGRILLDLCHFAFAAICVAALTRRRAVQAVVIAGLGLLALGPSLSQRLGADLHLDVTMQHELVAMIAFAFNAAITALIARLDVGSVDWVGTSMGGLIGMSLAALPNSPIRRMVLNDIGPVISKASLQRISDYVGLDYRFSSLDALERHLRKIHAPFGPLTDAQWRYMARYSQRDLGDGNLGLAYDPAIAHNVKLGVADVDLWALWERINCPVLVLRGADSDILSAEVAQMMTMRGPKAELITFAGVGHAPALMAQDQIDIVTEWLTKTS